MRLATPAKPLHLPVTVASPQTDAIDIHSVAQGLLLNPAMESEMAGHRRRKDSPQRIDEPDLGTHPSGVLRLIDTQFCSHKVDYVNQVSDALMKAIGDTMSVALLTALSDAGLRRPESTAYPRTARLPTRSNARSAGSKAPA